MAFLTSYRAEKIYFEKLRNNIDIAKSYIQRGATDEVMALLQNAVDADGAIMLCYRNLGEVWADLAAQLEKTQKALEDLKNALEEYHDDLNKKIDEINNYLVRLINALDERVTILENESKVKFAYLNYDSVQDVYSIEYNGETADFDALSVALEYPHLLVLIDNDNGNIYYPRSVSDVLIDFHADGVSGSDYVDISVTITDSDVVTVTEKTVINYTFGTGFNVSSTNEVTPDLTVLQAKLTAGTGINIDPDTNEISADFSEVQAKLTEGTGIDIDSNNNISVDTTVIQEKLTEGFGIDIDSNNEIKVDTTDIQEKLIAGQNITLTPDSTDPTKTVIAATGGASYTAGKGILINNNVISNKFPPASFASSGNRVIQYSVNGYTTSNFKSMNGKLINGTPTTFSLGDTLTNKEFFRVERIANNKLYTSETTDDGLIARIDVLPRIYVVVDNEIVMQFLCPNLSYSYGFITDNNYRALYFIGSSSSVRFQQDFILANIANSKRAYFYCTDMVRIEILQNSNNMSESDIITKLVGALNDSAGTINVFKAS